MKMSYKQLNELHREGKFTELIAGVFYNHPSPSNSHQQIAYNLVKEVGTRIDKLGTVRIAPFDVILSPADVLQPDFIFVSKKSKARIAERGIEGTPDLVIEIISLSDETHDTVRKKSVYQTYGLRHLWFFHPKKKTVEILQLKGHSYVTKAVHTEKDVFSVPIFPGVRFRCPRIFHGVD